jgi:serine kinase of HPr protein (carbohydrate metabolism regulator)
VTCWTAAVKGSACSNGVSNDFSEAAVRNFVLNQRGIDGTKEFIERQQRLMEDGA